MQRALKGAGSMKDYKFRAVLLDEVSGKYHVTRGYGLEDQQLGLLMCISTEGDFVDQLFSQVELDENGEWVMESIDQWTGKTVEGGDIFDGDICDCDGLIGVVFWDDTFATWRFHSEELLFEVNWARMEKIGNKYMNPELLEAGEA
jgi:hypothetical protein